MDRVVHNVQSESLEARRLLSVSISQEVPYVSIDGTDGADYVTVQIVKSSISRYKDQLVVKDHGVLIRSVDMWYKQSNIDENPRVWGVYFDGKKGNDHFEVVEGLGENGAHRALDQITAVVGWNDNTEERTLRGHIKSTPLHDDASD